MKKLIIILAAVLVLLVGVVGVIALTSFDVYKAQEKVNYEEVFDSSTPTVYYYYGPTCIHCHGIKPQVNKYAEQLNQIDGIDFKLVDTSDPANQGVFVGREYKADINQMNLTQEVKIQGTPGAAYIKDGQVQNYGIGEEVFDVFEAVGDEYGVKTDFNRAAING